MAYYEDLSACDYFGVADGRLLAVGWLDPQHVFAEGRTSEQFYAPLFRLLANPWQPLAFAGRHPCPFCRFTGGPSQLCFEGVTVPLGASNVFVPTVDTIFVAPSLILHYVDAHKYYPPEIFQRAVEYCPPMRSIKYLKAMRELGLPGSICAG